MVWLVRQGLVLSPAGLRSGVTMKFVMGHDRHFFKKRLCGPKKDAVVGKEPMRTA